ncbi:MAG TPA: T9SS type A sorting domain-containing protein [Bacteroidia bacterium]|jgi:hypothetical protein|nr:T9SS type A sorting domain-containing protein [Bacteroidia bacterium]
MKKNQLLFSFAILSSLVFASKLKAQITLTSADMPKVGNKVVYGHDTVHTSVSKLTAPMMGASVTWNYSSLPTAYRDTDAFVNPASTPYGAKYPTATVADTVYGSVGYTYFDVTTGSSTVVGAVQKLQGYKAGTTFNPAVLQMNLPGNYGNISGGVSNGIVPPFPVKYGPFDSARATLKVTYQDTIAAWGSLITPFYSSTYSVLCQKHYELDIDSVYLRDSTSKTWALLVAQKTKVHQYRWYTNGIGSALAVVSMDTANKNVTSLEWYDGYPNDINEVSQKYNTLVYPNPCNGQINFCYTGQNAQYAYVYDIEGRELKQSEIKEGKTTLNVSAYPAGIYLYHITDKSGNTVDAGKFTVIQ